jgi:hypothetical protein
MTGKICMTGKLKPEAIRKTFDKTTDMTTSHSTRLSAEELLAGHPKDDNQVAGYVRAPV